jgi:aldose 1-epimerase
MADGGFRMTVQPTLFAAAMLLLAACKSEPKPMTMPSTDRVFGTTPEGVEVRLYTLRNAHGMRATITNYGGIVTSLVVPDRTGRPGDIVLGFDSLEGYLRGSPYFGAIVGRYANRIANARFTLDGKAYRLAANDGANALHGGVKGFDKVVWEATPFPDSAPSGLRLHYVSSDGEEGYPGRLDVTVTYEVTDANELRITYHATTDKATVLNLSHHGYFNLAGQASPSILGHELLIAADRYTPVDASLIPTGEFARVTGSAFDFQAATPIGARIGADDRQLRYGKGYDHNFVILGTSGTLRLAARLRDPESGRTMEVLTTEPGIQFYSGNFLDGTLVGKGGARYLHRSGLCLETQHFPDSPHHAGFPTTVLRTGETFRSETVYRFSAQ